MHSSFTTIFRSVSKLQKKRKKRWTKMKNYFVIFFREKERETDKQGSGRRFMIQKDSNQRIPMKKKCHILYV